MKKVFVLLLGLVLLISLVLPTAILADKPSATEVYLHNTGSTPAVGGQWHFVLNGLVVDYDSNITLHVLWSDLSVGVYPATDAIINQHQASWAIDYDGVRVPVWTGSINPPADPTTSNCTYASAPNGSTGILTLSAPIAPVPEAPALVLLGLGLAGVAAFVIIKKKKSPVKVN